MKKIIPFMCLVSLTTGCTMNLWDSNPVKTLEYKITTEMTDYVMNSFQYKNLRLLSQQGRSEQDLNIPAEGVGFLGENYIYILTSGATDLLSLNQYASEFPFVSRDSDDAIRLKLLTSASPQSVGMFEDNYVVKINKPGNSLSSENVRKIISMGFVLKGGYYLKTIKIKGVFFKKSQMPVAMDMPSSLNHKYKIEFYTKKSEYKVNVLNLTGNIIFTPVTAAADIIVIPMGYAFLALITE